MSADFDTIRELFYKTGHDHGRNAGSWVIEGNTTKETAQKILEGIANGDPEIMDRLPSNPLSGEWAGDPIPNTLFADLGLNPEEFQDEQDELLCAFEAGFSDGVEDEVTGSARYIIRDECRS